MSAEMPEIRVRSVWKLRLARAGMALSVAAAAAGVWIGRRAWLPPLERLARATAGRFSAELVPVQDELAKRFAAPAADPSALHPSADRLSAPSGLPSRPRGPELEPARVPRATELLRKRDIRPEDEVRPAVGGPVLLSAPERLPWWERTAAPVILVALGLSCFFLLWAWYRGSPRSRTLT